MAWNVPSEAVRLHKAYARGMAILYTFPYTNASAMRASAKYCPQSHTYVKQVEESKKSNECAVRDRKLIRSRYPPASLAAGTAALPAPRSRCSKRCNYTPFQGSQPNLVGEQ